MTAFHYVDGELVAEDVPLADIAKKIGTPCYVYSRREIDARWRAFDVAFGQRPHLVCYAVKANSNLAVLNLLARNGSGFDIVSGGELQRVLAAGGDPAKIVFSGVGKSVTEMRAALDAGIGCFNVESAAELDRLNDVASQTGRRAPVSIRVNPDVDANTHPYISTGLKDNKFGVDIEQAPALYEHAVGLAHVNVIGVGCHIGSQLTSTAPFRDAAGRIAALAEALLAHGVPIRQLDFGGGLGIRYRDETPPAPADYVHDLLAVLDGASPALREARLLIEPGRAIVGNAGVLVTRVEYLKHSAHRNFAIVDAAMNDLMRPALYDAWHDIVSVQTCTGAHKTYDVVGPVCESGDFLGRERSLALMPGELLAVMSAGAYGASMSSNYNTRPRAAEVMVDGRAFHVVRRRETIEELIAPESVLPPS